MDKHILLVVYLIFINLVGLLAMYQDKRRAILHHWRIPEKMLWTIAFLMGSLGTTAGMWLFSHKSSKPRFFIGFPMLCVVQIILLCGIIG